MSESNQSQSNPTPVQRNTRNQRRQNQRAQMMQQRYQNLRNQQQSGQQPFTQSVQPPTSAHTPSEEKLQLQEVQSQEQPVTEAQPQLLAMENTFSLESLSQRQRHPVHPEVRPTRQQLLNWINEVSFAVVDITLYLDTHPCDKDALDYFNEYSCLRNKALAEYASLYGPLTIDTADDCASESFQWVLQPWPWEGGSC